MKSKTGKERGNALLSKTGYPAFASGGSPKHEGGKGGDKGKRNTTVNVIVAGGDKPSAPPAPAGGPPAMPPHPPVAPPPGAMPPGAGAMPPRPPMPPPGAAPGGPPPGMPMRKRGGKVAEKSGAERRLDAQKGKKPL